MIRPVTPSDAEQIASIYNHYIESSIATFETETIRAVDMVQRIEETLEANLPYLVYEQNGQVLGYSYASKWKGRCAYRFSVESTVYLHPSAHGKGLGTLLYQALMANLTKQGFHVVIAGISLPNDASVALHEKLGMKKVAQFEEVGFKFDNWVDVGYWQKKLTKI